MCRRRNAAAWCWSIRRSSRTAISVRLAHGLAAAHRKWATGIYALWYPIKGRSEPDALAKRLRRLGIGKMLRAELTVAPLSDPTRLNGCGLILVNPPWTLESELSVLLPALAGILGRDGKGGFRLDWLDPRGGAGRPVTLWPLSTAAQLVCSSALAGTFRLLVGGRRSD